MTRDNSVGAGEAEGVRTGSYVYVVTREYTWGGDEVREVVGVAENDEAADHLIAEHRAGLTRVDGQTRLYETVEYEVAAADPSSSASPSQPGRGVSIPKVADAS